MDELNDLRKRHSELEKLFNDQHWSEKALDEIEKRYRSLIETDLYGICELNSEGEIIYMNPVLHTILGYPDGELRGRQIWELIESETAKAELTEHLSKVAEGEYTSFPFSGKFKRKDGETIDIEADWKQRRDVQGRVTGFVSVVSDIIENRRALENSVRATTEKLESFGDCLNGIRQKIEGDTKKDQIIEDLNRELQAIRKSEKEKSEELQQLKGQKDFIEPLMMLLNDIQMQIDQVRDDFQYRSDEEKKKESAIEGLQAEIHKSSEFGEQMVEELSQLSRIADSGSETVLKIDDIRRKVDTLQEIIANHINEKQEPERAYQISALVDTSSLIDLKLDRVQQQFDYFQQDFQEFKKVNNESKDVKIAESVHRDDAAESMTQKLEVIQEQMHYLQGEFTTKLKVDAQKDKIIDNLHQELQEYKGDIQKKLLQSMIMDIIQIVDNIRKLTSHYASKDPSENDAEKLLKLLESIPSDLEDIFLWQGIKPFTCNMDTFDPSRQRVLKKLETGDKEKDKSIAESIRPGYEWDGKVIRPEMVAAYIYKEVPDEIEVRSSDE